MPPRHRARRGDADTYRTLLSAVVACRAPLFKEFVVALFGGNTRKAEDVVAKASLVLNVSDDAGAVSVIHHREALRRAPVLARADRDDAAGGGHHGEAAGRFETWERGISSSSRRRRTWATSSWSSAAK